VSGFMGGFRSVAFAAGCFAFAFVGCTQILGFESPVVVHCILSSECPDKRYPICRTNVCTPQCVADVDCEEFPGKPTCLDMVCVTTPVVSGADSAAEAESPSGSMDGASTKVAMDSPPADANEASTDVGDAGQGACGCSCPLGDCSEAGPGCFESWYTPIGKVQDPGPTQQYWGVPAGELAGQRIHVSDPGCLVRMGLFVSSGQDRAQSSPTEYEIGLYDEGVQGGYPNKVIWRSGATAVKSQVEQNEVAVTPPIPLQPGDYWIVGSWTNVMAFETYPTTGNWVEVYTPSFDAPWPDLFPPPSQQPPSYTNHPQAIEYAVVVSPPQLH
jgi:hypothetical protein